MTPAGDGAGAPLPSTAAPSPRLGHTAVWTGTEMLVWGGGPGAAVGPRPLGDGGRYEPATDTWSPISAAGAPSARSGHTAVWTGAAMLVWGGSGPGVAVLGDGAAYAPAADAWRPLPGAGAPSPRTSHAVVWTGGPGAPTGPGAELLVWGGLGPGSRPLNDGAAYDPGADAWRPLPAGGG